MVQLIDTRIIIKASKIVAGDMMQGAHVSMPYIYEAAYNKY
jgi:hypothetical protein